MFLNGNLWIAIENLKIAFKISLKLIYKARINNISPLVQIMACRLLGAKPLSEPMMFNLLIHISPSTKWGVKNVSRRCHMTHFDNDISVDIQIWLKDSFKFQFVATLSLLNFMLVQSCQYANVVTISWPRAEIWTNTICVKFWMRWEMH